MFSRLSRFYNSIKLLLDLSSLGLAFALAYVTRFDAVGGATPPPLDNTLVALALILVVFPLALRQGGLYTTNRNRSDLSEVFEIFRAFITGTVILLAASYFVSERYSRGTLLLFSGYGLAIVTAVRLVFRRASDELRRRGINTKSILMVGSEALAARILETIEQHRELGFRVEGLLTRHPRAAAAKVDPRIPLLGSYRDLAAVLDAHPVDQVILALPAEEQPLLRSLMEVLALRTVDVKLVPDLFSYVTLRGGLEEFGGLPLIRLQGDPMEGWNRVLKRAFDLCLASLALVIAAPLMGILAVAVRLSSPGPVLYRQVRMGIDGRLFEMIKFRTMRVDAEVAGARFATPGDPRRTALGTWMRRLSLDELPQLLNVVRGEMSLVGPRPERPVFIDEFKKRVPRYQLRHMMKAGITGWAQVNGLRGDTSIEERIDYDLYYIENWSLGFDVKILLRTVFGGFLSKNAY